jgi:hypothetical protein
MSASDAAKKLVGKFNRLGRPPAPTDILGNLQQPEPGPRRPGRPRKAEKMVQLNLRVPQEFKDRVRLLAARDRMEMSEVVMEALALYEAKFGAAPKLEPSRRPDR